MAKHNILLGLTGSVATKLAPKIYKSFLATGSNVKIVVTNPAKYFIPEIDTSTNTRFVVPSWDFYEDKDEWPLGGYHKDDPVKHIEFRDWADKFVIAPITANTLAKISYGLCDKGIQS